VFNGQNRDEIQVFKSIIYERMSSCPMKLRIVSLEPFMESLLDMICGKLDEAMRRRLNVVES